MATTESAAAAAAKGLPAGWSAEKSVSGRWSYSCGSESFSSLARALRFATEASGSVTEEEAPAVKVEAGVVASADDVGLAAIVQDANDEGLSQYELERRARIARNEAYMASLGLGGGLAPADGPKRGGASQRGVSRKRAKKAPSEPPRRSQRVQGIGADGAALPANFREPSSYAPAAAVSWSERPRNLEDVTFVADDHDDDAAAAAAAARCGAVVAGGGGDVRSSAPSMAAADYRASLTAMRLAEGDVAKVTKDRTYSLAWLPVADRLVLAAGDKSGRLGIWNVDDDDGETCCVQFSDAHARPVTALAWDGAQLFSGGYDSFVRKSDFAGGGVRSVVVADYDGDDVDDLAHWCLGGDGPTTVWGAHKCGGLTRHDARQPRGAKKLVVDAHSKKVAHVAARPRHDHVATSSNDGELKVWDVRMLSAKKPTPLAVCGHQKSIHGFDFSADGLKACTVSYDNTVAFWDLAKTPKAPACVRVTHDNQTGRYLTPFKPIFDPHAPHDVIVVGSMAKPRAIDLVQAKAPHYLIKLNDKMTVFHAVTSIHAVHPAHHIIAGANNSGRVSLWRG